ncbi:MAG: MBL fold metallo-hydrolase, partial [Phascolarctobacterium sp.]|nr:MBL fold metallo-hydrolase [Phascolarctobacterium sp.]
MNAFKVTMLASGSKGNSALISTGKQNFLVDMGISCKMLTSRLKEVGFSVEDLDGIFLTHEHTDHVKG